VTLEAIVLRFPETAHMENASLIDCMIRWSFYVFLDFHMIGEDESSAGLRLLFARGVLMIILFVGLDRLLWIGRKKKS
jgi:hypothetical protein